MCVCAFVCVGGKATHTTDYCSFAFDTLFSPSVALVYTILILHIALRFSVLFLPSHPLHVTISPYLILSYLILSYLILSILPNSFAATSALGVVDHGIFAGFTTAVIVAGKDGVRVAGAGGEKPWW